MEYIVIMEYTSGNVYYSEFGSDKNVEEFFKEHGIEPDNCAWLYTSKLPSFININYSK